MDKRTTEYRKGGQKNIGQEDNKTLDRRATDYGWMPSFTQNLTMLNINSFPSVTFKK